MNNILEALINQGSIFNFQNNSYTYSHGTFSKASDELLAWIANVEHYIIENYDENSGPFNLFKTFKRSQLSGNYQPEFDEQMTILRGSLIACKQIPAKKKVRLEDDNLIIGLIKNPVFWTVIVVIMGGSFSFGSNFSSSKFDKDKNELYEENKALKSNAKNSINTIAKQDSTIKNISRRLNLLENQAQKQ